MNEHKAFPLFTALGGINEKYISDAPVSYTHLTLPTTPYV